MICGLVGGCGASMRVRLALHVEIARVKDRLVSLVIDFCVLEVLRTLVALLSSMTVLCNIKFGEILGT